MTQKDENTVAIVVRMGYRSLVEFIFVMGMVLYFVVDSIPNFVEYYSSLPRLLGIPLLIGFCFFLWRLGTMIVTFVQSYLDMRDLYTTVVITMRDVRGKMVFGGKVHVSED